MIYNRFNREISCHHITVSLHHRITESLCQSVICLAPCHQASQSFALPPATKPVSHLPCLLPPHHRITASLHHRVTTPLHHRVTMSLHLRVTVSPRHCISQSFALPPATKPVSHLPCPLPLHHCVTASPHHCISQSFALPPATKPVSHFPCPLPPNQSVICLAPYHHATASLRHRVTASLH